MFFYIEFFLIFDMTYLKIFRLEGHKMDVEKALNTCDSKYPTILLAHNPKGAKLAAESKQKIDLILSGTFFIKVL